MPSLTRIEAAERTELLSTRSYHVELDLTRPDTFRSTTTIAFDAARANSNTFLDVQPSALHSVTLNGRELDTSALRDGRFPLTGLAERNELVVVADMAYSKEGEGLQRHVDPADGKVYIYASVFMEYAPRIFGCFDQPDLKAPFTFTVTVPEGNGPDEEWQVLGSGAATRLGPQTWQVVQPLPLSTYLVTVVAGPYASFYSEHDGVPLGWHCRASLATALQADVDEVFTVTGQVLDEFHRLFGVRYPFGTFHQVFVPEFTYLSLDHPGCVLIKELYLFRAPAPRSEHETRAVVITHGLSLMWLAGLVTNKWWNDLWLGQAFADYMAHRVTGDVTEYVGGPLTTFAVRRKAQAYVADQRPSTHPVCIEAPDALTALLDLDRISYFKGSSALRQLATHMGDDALRAGLRTYFARHAYGSATFEDFLTAISEASGRDMHGWARTWLQSSNVNTLRPELLVEGGKIASAAVVQTAPDTHPVLRTHTMDVGLYDSTGAGAVTRVTIDGERTELPELVGRPAPAFLLLNDGDYTYAKVRFDEASLAALPDMLPRLSPINRAMVWCALLLAVQDGVYPAAAHLDLVARMIPVETELSVVVEVLEQARIDVADRFLEPALRPAAMARIAQSCRDRLARVDAGDELALALFRGLIEFSADVAELRGWLDGTPPPAGLTLDPDLSWRIRYRLSVLGALTEAEIDDALRADPSTHGEQSAAKCRAARPDPAAKASAWKAITSDTGLSSFGLWALAEGFWQPEQLELTAPYVERFFTEMPDAAALRGDSVLDWLVRFGYPRLAASPSTLEHAEKMLAREDIPLPLRRRVIDFTDDLRRVVDARASAASARAADARIPNAGARG
jgi:aminopeptidase N